MNEICQYLEMGLYLFIIILVLKTYIKMHEKDRKIFKWFIFTNIFHLLNIISFYIVEYIPANLMENVSLWGYIFNCILLMLWLFSMIIFLHEILTRGILPLQVFYKLMISLIVLNFVILILFFIPLSNNSELPYWQYLSLMTNIFIELVLFDLSILALILCRNQGISLILAGFIIHISGDSFIVSCYISKAKYFLNYGISLYLLGIFAMFFGTILINRINYNIKSWFRNYSSIISQLIIWSFAVSYGSFILFFIIAYIFNIINKEAFIGLPSFIMIYSVVIIRLSMLMGKYFMRYLIGK